MAELINNRDKNRAYRKLMNATENKLNEFKAKPAQWLARYGRFKKARQMDIAERDPEIFAATILAPLSELAEEGIRLGVDKVIDYIERDVAAKFYRVDDIAREKFTRVLARSQGKWADRVKGDDEHVKRVQDSVRDRQAPIQFTYSRKNFTPYKGNGIERESSKKAAIKARRRAIDRNPDEIMSSYKQHGFKVFADTAGDSRAEKLRSIRGRNTKKLSSRAKQRQAKANAGQAMNSWMEHMTKMIAEADDPKQLAKTLTLAKAGY